MTENGRRKIAIQIGEMFLSGVEMEEAIRHRDAQIAQLQSELEEAKKPPEDPAQEMLNSR